MSTEQTIRIDATQGLRPERFPSWSPAARGCHLLGGGQMGTNGGGIYMEYGTLSVADAAVAVRHDPRLVLPGRTWTDGNRPPAMLPDAVIVSCPCADAWGCSHCAQGSILGAVQPLAVEAVIEASGVAFPREGAAPVAWWAYLAELDRPAIEAAQHQRAADDAVEVLRAMGTAVALGVHAHRVLRGECRVTVWREFIAAGVVPPPRYGEILGGQVYDVVQASGVPYRGALPPTQPEDLEAAQRVLALVA